MEQEIKNKIERFIELSAKFTKAPDKYPTEYSIGISGSISLSGISIGTIKSAAQTIREQAEKDASLCEEYDEYRELQKDLAQYFKTVNKLTNK